MPERVDTLFETLMVVQVADHQDESCSGSAARKIVHDGRQVGVLAGGFQVFEKSEQRQHVVFAAHQGHRVSNLFVVSDDRNAIQVGQGNVSQRSGQLAGEIELVQTAARLGQRRVHADAGVQQHVNVQVFFFLKAFEQHIAVPSVHTPVQVAKIVAVDVFAVVGKFDTAAGLFGPPLREQLTLEHSFGKE